MLSQEYLPILWIGTAISFFLFIVFALSLRKNISFFLRRKLPWFEAGRKHPSSISSIVWIMFWGMGLTSLGGSFLLAAAVNSNGAVENSFISLPTQTPPPTLEPIDQSGVLVSLGFPDELDPCNVGALTLIPPEINPYDLPLVYPIEPWFEEGQFLQTAFAELRVTNRDRGNEIQVMNKVLLEVIRHDHLPGPLNAAFTLCETETPREFPRFELSASVSEASLVLSEEPYSVLRPGQSKTMAVSLFGLTPGLYETKLGIEYVDDRGVQTAWADQKVLVQVPERIQRWSAGVITYWGECWMEDSGYTCEEVVLEEPILETAGNEDGTSEASGTSSSAAVCPLAPPNRLKPGMTATLSRLLGLRLRLRTDPGLRSEIVTSFSRGTELEVVSGPVCKDGYYWYEVKTAWGSQTGWMAEGEPNLYYLTPQN